MWQASSPARELPSHSSLLPLETRGQGLTGLSWGVTGPDPALSAQRGLGGTFAQEAHTTVHQNPLAAQDTGGDLFSDLQRGDDVAQHHSMQSMPYAPGGRPPRKRMHASTAGSPYSVMAGSPWSGADQGTAGDGSGQHIMQAQPLPLYPPSSAISGSAQGLQQDTPWHFPNPSWTPVPTEYDQASTQPVPLRVSQTGAGALSRVSNDNRLYGLPEELSAQQGEMTALQASLAEDAATQLELSAHPGPLFGYDAQGMPIRTDPPPPPPEFYLPQGPSQIEYDEEADTLKAPDHHEVSRPVRHYRFVEEPSTGKFYRIQKPGVMHYMRKGNCLDVGDEPERRCKPKGGREHCAPLWNCFYRAFCASA